MKLKKLGPDLEQILKILKNYPEGAKIGLIEDKLSYSIPRRTLSRYLATLLEMGKIESKGERRGTIYFSKGIQNILPLSKKGAHLKEIINLPLQQRKPVTYNVDFLYNYNPNSTFYLTQKERKHLYTVGQQFKIDLAPGTYISQIYQKMLVDLSWNSSRLEGNTYSLLETQRLIEFGLEAEGKNAIESQMILNHKEAIEFLVKNASSIDFNQYTILNIHALLSNNLLANPRARGAIRNIPVGIGGTVYQPTAIPQIINDCFQKILYSAKQIKDPFEQAFFMMVHIPYLQPFEDLNKRVSRISSNIPLIKHNLSPLSFIDVPKDDYMSGILAIYELNKIDLIRDIFIWAYERSAQKYKLVQNIIGEPNIIGIKYKKELFDIIHHIVQNNIQGKQMIELIKKFATKNIHLQDKDKFIQMVESELMSLHEGNIAIYDISRDYFLKWRPHGLGNVDKPVHR